MLPKLLAVVVPEFPTIAPAFATPSAIAVIVLALALTAVGFVNARRTARVLRVDVPLAGLPDALHGFSIAQISDIHVGATIKNAYVRAIVDRVNGLEADLIAITGDVVDGSVEHLAEHTRPLGELRARHGAFVVTGNHEYYSGADAWVSDVQDVIFPVQQVEGRGFDIGEQVVEPPGLPSGRTRSTPH